MNLLKKSLFGIPAWVYLAAFLPRLLLLAAAFRNPAYCMTLDSRIYLALASALSRTGFFGLPGPGGLSLAETFRTPGYPLFLILAGALPGDRVLNAAILQTLVGALTVLLAWKWFYALAGRRGAAAGTLFLSLDYISIMHTPLTIAEAPLMLAVLLAGSATWKALEDNSAARACGSGALWALAAFIKPVTLYLPFLLAPLFWKNKKHLLLFLLFSFSIPFGWSLRNYARTGHFSYSSIGGVILLKYSAGSVEALRTGRSFGETSAALLAAAEAAGPYADDAARSSAYSARALPILAAHPVLTARYLLHDLLATIGGSGVEMLPQALGLKTDFPVLPAGPGSGMLTLLRAYPALWLLQIVYMLFLAAVYLFFARGLFLLAASGRKVFAAYLFITVAYLFLIASTNGYYRYRIPPMLFMAVGAAIALGKPSGKEPTGPPL